MSAKSVASEAESQQATFAPDSTRSQQVFVDQLATIEHCVMEQTSSFSPAELLTEKPWLQRPVSSVLLATRARDLLQAMPRRILQSHGKLVLAFFA